MARKRFLGVGLLAGSFLCVPALAEELEYKNVSPQELGEVFSLIETPIGLSFLSNFENFQNTDYENARLSSLAGRVRDLKAQKALSFCDRALLAKAENILSIYNGRKDIALALEVEFKQVPPEQGIIEFENHQKVYRHFLREWLGSDVEPEALYILGIRELERANEDYKRVQTLIENRGTREPPKLTKEDVRKLLQEKEKIVLSNMSSLFYDDYQYANVKIIASDRGEDFPVAGYYNPFERAFYFNQLKDQSFTYQLDWLYLHEAVPGHHFQSELSQGEGNCLMPVSQVNNSTFAEGWGAYVETLGKELGLYQTLEEELSAIEWNLVRSARVALDVGINYYGWDDEKAHAFWKEHIPVEITYADREITRIRNWPIQVITYKYGAYRIQRAREVYFDLFGAKGDIREFHDLMLKARDIPVDHLEDYIEAAFAETETALEGG